MHVFYWKSLTESGGVLSHPQTLSYLQALSQANRGWVQPPTLHLLRDLQTPQPHKFHLCMEHPRNRPLWHKCRQRAEVPQSGGSEDLSRLIGWLALTWRTSWGAESDVGLPVWSWVWNLTSFGCFSLRHWELLWKKTALLIRRDLGGGGEPPWGKNWFYCVFFLPPNNYLHCWISVP